MCWNQQNLTPPSGFVKKSPIISSVGGAVGNYYLGALLAVNHEEVTDVHVLYSFAAGALSILLQQHCTLIVLVNHAGFHVVSLCLKEVSGPQDGPHVVMNCHHLRLCRVGWVYLCLVDDPFIIPLPNVMNKPMWLCMSSCTANASSISQ